MLGGLPTCCPKKGLAQGSRDAGRPTYLLPQKGACARFPGCREAYLLVAPKRSLSKVPWTQGGLHTPTCCPKKELAHTVFYSFFGPRCACQASTAFSRAWKPLHTPQSTLVR